MKFDYETIKMDYVVNDGDDDEMVNIKESIDKLTAPEKRILLTYVHFGTYAAVARQYNVSPPTAKTYIEAVKNKLKKIIDNDTRPSID